MLYWQQVKLSHRLPHSGSDVVFSGSEVVESAPVDCEKWGFDLNGDQTIFQLPYLLERAPWRSFILGGFRCGA